MSPNSTTILLVCVTMEVQEGGMNTHQRVIENKFSSNIMVMSSHSVVDVFFKVIY